MPMRANAVVTTTLLLVSLRSAAQIKEIDPLKLPQDPAVQSAYRHAQEMEPFAQAWTPKWNYTVPQAQVQSQLADSLGILSKALEDDPGNHELQLLTGLVAHFAYNVNDEAAFDTAVADLTKATASDPTDFRGEWFLGIDQCQSLQVVAGMNRLLAVEQKAKEPPVDFWDDYIACANVALMPAHTLQAVDHEIESGQSADRLKTVSDIAGSRYKTADLATTIPVREAWGFEKRPNDYVAFTSRLCGVSFTVPGDSPLQLNDIQHGVCSVILSPAGKGPESGATILLMARAPATGETLDKFARSFLNRPNAQISTPPQSSCSFPGCKIYDVLLPDMYPKQGGGHILLATFERDQPRYDGLLFEKPQGPPTDKAQPGPVAFRADPNFRRIPGKLFYVVVLDSNQQIFAASKPHFDAFLQSLTVE